MITSCWILTRIRCFRQGLWRKSKHTFVFSKFYLGKLCRLRDSLEICGRARQAADELIIWHMCFACWITKATNTHSECVIFVFLLQKCFRESFSILHLYIHGLSCCFCKSLSQKTRDFFFFYIKPLFSLLYAITV